VELIAERWLRLAQRMFCGEKTMIAKHVLRVVHEIGLMAGISIIWTANVSGKGLQPLIGTPLPDLAQVVSPFELRAINDPARAFCVIDRFVTDAPKRCPAARGPRSEGYITNEPANPTWHRWESNLRPPNFRMAPDRQKEHAQIAKQSSTQPSI
jgi:hypothetical protein